MPHKSNPQKIQDESHLGASSTTTKFPSSTRGHGIQKEPMAVPNTNIQYHLEDVEDVLFSSFCTLPPNLRLQRPVADKNQLSTSSDKNEEDSTLRTNYYKNKAFQNDNLDYISSNSEIPDNHLEGYSFLDRFLIQNPELRRSVSGGAVISSGFILMLNLITDVGRELFPSEIEFPNLGSNTNTSVTANQSTHNNVMSTSISISNTDAATIYGAGLWNAVVKFFLSFWSKSVADGLFILLAWTVFSQLMLAFLTKVSPDKIFFERECDLDEASLASQFDDDRNEKSLNSDVVEKSYEARMKHLERPKDDIFRALQNLGKHSWQQQSSRSRSNSMTDDQMAMEMLAQQQDSNSSPALRVRKLAQSARDRSVDKIKGARELARVASKELKHQSARVAEGIKHSADSVAHGIAASSGRVRESLREKREELKEDWHETYWGARDKLDQAKSKFSNRLRSSSFTHDDLEVNRHRKAARRSAARYEGKREFIDDDEDFAIVDGSSGRRSLPSSPSRLSARRRSGDVYQSAGELEKGNAWPEVFEFHSPDLNGVTNPSSSSPTTTRGRSRSRKRVSSTSGRRSLSPGASEGRKHRRSQSVEEMGERYAESLRSKEASTTGKAGVSASSNDVPNVAKSPKRKFSISARRKLPTRRSQRPQSEFLAQAQVGEALDLEFNSAKANEKRKKQSARQSVADGLSVRNSGVESRLTPEQLVKFKEMSARRQKEKKINAAKLRKIKKREKNRLGRNNVLTKFWLFSAWLFSSPLTQNFVGTVVRLLSACTEVVFLLTMDLLIFAKEKVRSCCRICTKDSSMLGCCCAVSRYTDDRRKSSILIIFNPLSELKGILLSRLQMGFGVMLAILSFNVYSLWYLVHRSSSKLLNGSSDDVLKMSSLSGNRFSFLEILPPHQLTLFGTAFSSGLVSFLIFFLSVALMKNGDNEDTTNLFLADPSWGLKQISCPAGNCSNIPVSMSTNKTVTNEDKVFYKSHPAFEPPFLQREMSANSSSLITNEVPKDEDSSIEIVTQVEGDEDLESALQGEEEDETKSSESEIDFETQDLILQGTNLSDESHARIFSSFAKSFLLRMFRIISLHAGDKFFRLLKSIFIPETKISALMSWFAEMEAEALEREDHRKNSTTRKRCKECCPNITALFSFFSTASQGINSNGNTFSRVKNSSSNMIHIRECFGWRHFWLKLKTNNNASNQNSKTVHRVAYNSTPFFDAALFEKDEKSPSIPINPYESYFKSSWLFAERDYVFKNIYPVKIYERQKSFSNFLTTKAALLYSTLALVKHVSDEDGLESIFYLQEKGKINAVAESFKNTDLLTTQGTSRMCDDFDIFDAQDSGLPLLASLEEMGNFSNIKRTQTEFGTVGYSDEFNLIFPETGNRRKNAYEIAKDVIDTKREILEAEILKKKKLKDDALRTELLGSGHVRDSGLEAGESATSGNSGNSAVIPVPESNSSTSSSSVSRAPSETDDDEASSRNYRNLKSLSLDEVRDIFGSGLFGQHLSIFFMHLQELVVDVSDHNQKLWGTKLHLYLDEATETKC